MASNAAFLCVYYQPPNKFLKKDLTQTRLNTKAIFDLTVECGKTLGKFVYFITVN